jgi:hypothetical protein
MLIVVMLGGAESLKELNYRVLSGRQQHSHLLPEGPYFLSQFRPQPGPNVIKLFVPNL